jgi:single-stranded-DNA-specific exonuclease
MDTGYPKYMGANEEHLRLFVKQQYSEGFAAIGFNLAHKKNVIANRNPFQMAYCIDENEWNGQISLQLRLKDIQ